MALKGRRATLGRLHASEATMRDDKSLKPFATRWRDRFAYALRGIGLAVRHEENFRVHLVAAAVVIAVGALLQVSKVEWLVLIFCITAVLAAEMFNTAIEHLSRAITREEHPEIRNALDIAAGGVLVVAIGAKVIWATVLGSRLLW